MRLLWPQLGRVRRFMLATGMVMGLDLLAVTLAWLTANQLFERPRELIAGAPLIVFFTPVAHDFEARISAASEAYRRHGRRPVVAVGGSRPSRNYYGSEALGKALVRLGVDPRDIVTERISFDTSGNIDAAIRLAGPERPLVLVTDRLHLLRIRWLMSALRPDIEVVLYPADSAVRPFELWWRLHYEVIAWSSMLLPTDWRNAALRVIRP
jgi:uncharacterized SAM-binding protein YcdF (DUF218 family)